MLIDTLASTRPAHLPLIFSRKSASLSGSDFGHFRSRPLIFVWCIGGEEETIAKLPLRVRFASAPHPPYFWKGKYCDGGIFQKTTAVGNDYESYLLISSI